MVLTKGVNNAFIVMELEGILPGGGRGRSSENVNTCGVHQIIIALVLRCEWRRLYKDGVKVSIGLLFLPWRTSFFLSS